jgi:hypothetical protein
VGDETADQISRQVSKLNHAKVGKIKVANKQLCKGGKIRTFSFKSLDRKTQSDFSSLTQLFICNLYFADLCVV